MIGYIRKIFPKNFLLIGIFVCHDNKKKVLYYFFCQISMINDGVYRSGFAKSQSAYEKAVKEVFKGLDRVEEILSKKHYLTGNQLTEADVRLYTSLIRFDCAYYFIFKV